VEGVLKINYEAKLFLFSHYADDCLSMNPVMLLLECFEVHLRRSAFDELFRGVCEA
jgi:hypothetical protein